MKIPPIYIMLLNVLLITGLGSNLRRYDYFIVQLLNKLISNGKNIVKAKFVDRQLLYADLILVHKIS